MMEGFAKLAKGYLGVPATTVPSERVFCKAGHSVSASRSALAAEYVDNLVFLTINMNLYVEDDD